jgi:hypothetical protein
MSNDVNHEAGVTQGDGKLRLRMGVEASADPGNEFSGEGFDSSPGQSDLGVSQPILH